MRFGKQLEAETVPSWAANYIEYKFLKKALKELAAKKASGEVQLTSKTFTALLAHPLPSDSSTSNPALRSGPLAGFIQVT